MLGTGAGVVLSAGLCNGEFRSTSQSEETEAESIEHVKKKHTGFRVARAGWVETVVLSA